MKNKKHHLNYGAGKRNVQLKIEYRPKIIEDNGEMRRFVEMCFEPNSSINDRLKQVIVEMLGEVKK